MAQGGEKIKDETAISFFDMIQVYIEKAYEEKHPEHVLKDE